MAPPLLRLPPSRRWELAVTEDWRLYARRGAAERLREAVAVPGLGGACRDCALLALVNHRLGEAGQAKEWLDRARRKKPSQGAQPTWEAAEATVFLGEAEKELEGLKRP